MIISRIKLKNWRNFRSLDISLGRRIFLVGPNASGKSNFLDVFRFLRDIAKSEGGGLQKAVNERGGISKIRCLAARKEPQIEIEVHLGETSSKKSGKLLSAPIALICFLTKVLVEKRFCFLHLTSKEPRLSWLLPLKKCVICWKEALVWQKPQFPEQNQKIFISWVSLVNKVIPIHLAVEDPVSEFVLKVMPSVSM